jgi:hypothetical protein
LANSCTVSFAVSIAELSAAISSMSVAVAQSATVDLDARTRIIAILDDLCPCSAADPGKQCSHVAGQAGESRRRELLRADLLDHSREFLFELACRPANEFTGAGRGVHSVAACKCMVD